MTDDFAKLIDISNAFFSELSEHNERSWFEANKARYTEQIKKPAELLGELLAEDITRLTERGHRAKLFRIHRDVRFSKDKTPYNAHLHLLWSPTDGEGACPAWFLGSSPSYLTAFTGLPGMSGEALARYRAMIDADGDEISDALQVASQDVGAAIADFGSEPLKRVPKPYDREHAHADLLRRKSLVVGAPPRADWREMGLISAVMATANALLPVWKLLDKGMR